jgi:hypothetical protein
MHLVLAYPGNRVTRVTVSVRGHPVEFIIDSGASVNIIDKEQLEELKKKLLKCHSGKCEKKLYAYGATEPLDLLGKFRAQISIPDTDNRYEAEFFVLNGNGPSLLSKDTAMKSEILKHGVHTLTPESIVRESEDCFDGIGKLKDFKLKLHIDKRVKPVAQAMYRILYSLRDKVSQQLEEL